MVLQADILVNNYGLPKDFAEKLVLFVKGDLEMAIRIIEAAEKDACTIKLKFISSKKKFYGVGLFFYNFQTSSLEYIIVAVSRDENLSKVVIEESWLNVHQEISQYKNSANLEKEISLKIENQILFPETSDYFSSFFVDKSTIDSVNLKRFLISEIGKIIGDSSLILKLSNENIDIFRLKNFLTEARLGSRLKAQNNSDLIVLLSIKVNPVLAPLGGKDIEKIQSSDEVLVKVVDSREIAAEILNFIEPSYSSTGSLHGKVVYTKKSKDTENTLVFIEFGPGIYGKFIIGGRVRVQVRETEKAAQEKINFVSSEPEIKAKEDRQADSLDNESDKKSFSLVVFIIILLLFIAFAVILWIMG
jgi:hypothetical protein